MIPEEIRDFETYIVACSGGKDSTATLLYALEHLPRERLRVVFCDTGAEWPETYEYLDYIERELGVTVERIRAGDRPLPPRQDGGKREGAAYGKSLFDMMRRVGKWPMPTFRYCTKYLKMWPLRLYAAQFSSAIQVEGTRAEESEARANSEEFEMAARNSVSGGGLGMGSVYRPVLGWSERRVWDYLRAHRILPNPVYNYATRCGCWCCIMGREAEVLNFCRLHPDVAQRAADLEEEIGHTWKDGQSIGNLLRRARAQMPLFEPRPRFAEVGA